MWSRVVEGRTLTFRLLGVNDQNFVMRDEETGTWWQQVTGEALLGPLRGQRLSPVPWSEVSFAIWRGENPDTDVLASDDRFADRYAPEDWDASMDGTPMPATLRGPPVLEPRDLVVGVRAGDQAMAYPLATLAERTPITDRVGGVPILVAMAADGRSVRLFDRRLDGEEIELYAVPDRDPPRFVDAGTGSEWDFAGRAVAGPLAGAELTRLLTFRDYWFDWANHNPGTGVYRAGR